MALAAVSLLTVFGCDASKSIRIEGIQQVRVPKGKGRVRVPKSGTFTGGFYINGHYVPAR